jgi:hypothetical protein
MWWSDQANTKERTALSIFENIDPEACPLEQLDRNEHCSSS